MARHRIALFKPWFVLIGFLFVWMLIPTFVKSFSRDAFAEFQAPFWKTISYLDDLQSFWGLRNHSKNKLIEAGRDLARLNAAYELKLQENAFLKHELHRLEHSLELPSLPNFRYEVARVCNRDLNLWWQQIIIRKGEAEGIFQGAAVVYAGGVVGKVKEVFKHTSIVELVSSRRFRVAAHFDEDERPVTYTGALNLAFGQPRGKIENVPEDIKASEQRPKKLVSSRLGGVFPDGLLIGWVDSLEPGFDGLFMQGNVNLEDRLRELKEVAVLIPIEREIEDEG